jgi:hypothetical protein
MTSSATVTLITKLTAYVICVGLCCTATWCANSLARNIGQADYAQVLCVALPALYLSMYRTSVC